MQCKASDAVKNTSPLESRAVERVTNNVSLSGVHLVTVRITASVMKSDYSGGCFSGTKEVLALQQTETFWTLSCNFVPT